MKNKSIGLLMFLLLWIQSNLHSQVIAEPPKWVNPINIKSIGAVNLKQVKDGYHFILVDEQYNTLEKHNYFHYANTALTEQALVNVSQIEFTFDPTYEKAVLHNVKIHRDNKTIDKTSTLDIKILNEESQRNSGILNGKKTLFSNLSDVRKGDIVEYSYSIIGKNPIMGDFFNYSLWFSYSVPVGRICTRVIFPKSVIPTISKFNTNINPQITQGIYNDYTWSIDNPKTTSYESSTPASYNPFPLVEISNVKNWNQTKIHWKSLFTTPKYNQVGIRKIVDSIISKHLDKGSQITSIVDFVQTQIRYAGNENGIYSHVPRTPDYVLNNRFGDCKEKSTMLNEMLRFIGIEAFPVLVNTTLGKKIENENPSITAFDHCISCFKYEGKNYFIDPTISYQRGNFKLRSIPNYEMGMILDNSSESFEKINIDVKSNTIIRDDFVIDSIGDARLKVTTICKGGNADDIRYLFLNNSIEDIQATYKKFYDKYTDEIEVLDTVSFVDDFETNTFTITENYLLKKLWTVKDSTISNHITQSFIPYALNAQLIYGEESKRNDPLRINHPVNYKYTITVAKEGGWSVDNESHSEVNKYFNYTYTVKTDEGKLILNYEYVSNTNIIEASDYLDYKKKMDFINNNMIFSAQEKSVVDGTYGFNWALLVALLSGLVLALVLVWISKMYPYHSPFENKYNYIGGWLMLLSIIVTIQPISFLYDIYNSLKDVMNIDYAFLYFNEKSTFFNPIKGYYALLIPMCNVLMFGYSIYIAMLFYKFKSTFRTNFIYFKIFNSLFLIFNVIVMYCLYSDTSDPEERLLLSRETNTLIKVLINSFIWGPYIWFSERSRHTFTDSDREDTVSEDLQISESLT